jgi:hypothetical protein
LKAPEYSQVSAIHLESRFMKRAVYVCDFELKKGGTIVRDFYAGRKRISHQKTEDASYVCGPLVFRLYFFFRDLDKYKIAQKTRLYTNKLDFEETDLKEFLDKWGGIKIYRDCFRIKPYGDRGNDWLGLDKLRVDQPTVYPENEQVLGFIQITKKDNPRLIDTTTREGLINNQAFQDMVRFAQESIKFFADSRRGLKDKELGAKAIKKKRAKRVPKKSIPRSLFLNFSGQYQDPFYEKLEEEINLAYSYGLPNATMILLRKMIEDFVYSILQLKFGENGSGLWWDEKKNRELSLGVLIRNLAENRDKFKYDEPQLIEKFLELVNPFLKEANKKAHHIIEYLDRVDELEKFKIPEIISLLVKLKSKLKQS